jgi:hypothetical protein
VLVSARIALHARTRSALSRKTWRRAQSSRTQLIVEMVGTELRIGAAGIRFPPGRMRPRSVCLLPRPTALFSLRHYHARGALIQIRLLAAQALPIMPCNALMGCPLIAKSNICAGPFERLTAACL